MSKLAAIRFDRPRHCVWELTLACNLRCGHCGSRAGRPRPDELTTAECVDLVHQLVDLECRLITLSGGEPTLRPDWEEIARAAIARGVTVNMVTNGMTMTDRLARRVAQSGLSNVGLSLDGTETTHERVRGRGTFERLVRATERLRRAGVPFSLLTHLNRDTALELKAVHDLAVDLGARVWRVQLGKPMGNLSDSREWCIQPKDLLTVIPTLARLKARSSIELHVGDSIGYYGPHEKLLRHTNWGNMEPLWAGCQAGLRTIGIESDGGIKGCLSLQAGLAEHPAGNGADPFREGDIRSRRLADLWFDPEAFAFNRQQRPADLTGACRRCRWAARCRGGAKCVSSAFTGRLGEDPYCYYHVWSEATQQGQGRMRRTAVAAMVSLGLGLGASCLGGCLDRSVGIDPTQDAAVTQPDAEPPYNYDYGVVPWPVDAAVEADAAPDAEPPCDLDYGVFPEPEPMDAGVDADFEPPDNGDYGDIPPGNP